MTIPMRRPEIYNPLEVASELKIMYRSSNNPLTAVLIAESDEPMILARNFFKWLGENQGLSQEGAYIPFSGHNSEDIKIFDKGNGGREHLITFELPQDPESYSMPPGKRFSTFQRDKFVQEMYSLLEGRKFTEM